MSHDRFALLRVIALVALPVLAGAQSGSGAAPATRGFFWVRVGARWGAIDRSGAEVIPPTYIDVREPREGLAWCKEPGGDALAPKVGFVDTSGTVVFSGTWSAGDCVEGRIRVEDGRGAYHLDARGERAYAARWRKVSDFADGFAVAAESGRYVVIDRDGKTVASLAPHYPLVIGGVLAPPTHGRIGYHVSDGSAGGYLDTRGHVVIEPRAHMRVRPFSTDRAWVTSALFGSALIDPTGRVFPVGGVWDDRHRDFADGLAAVHVAGRGWGWVDGSGRMAIAPRFRDVGPFSEGLAAAREDGPWGYVDRTGAWILTPSFDIAQPFRDGLARVAIRETAQYRDRTGKVVWAGSTRFAPHGAPDVPAVVAGRRSARPPADSADGALRELAPAPLAFQGEVIAGLLDPAGAWVAGTDGDALRVWELPSLRERAWLDIRDTGCVALSAADDGALCWAGPRGVGRLAVSDAEAHVWPYEGGLTVVVSFHGSELARWDAGARMVRRSSLADGTAIGTCALPAGDAVGTGQYAVRALRYSPDGTRIAAMALDERAGTEPWGDLLVWTVADGQLAARARFRLQFMEARDAVNALQWLDDDALVHDGESYAAADATATGPVWLDGGPASPSNREGRTPLFLGRTRASSDARWLRPHGDRKAWYSLARAGERWVFRTEGSVRDVDLLDVTAQHVLVASGAMMEVRRPDGSVVAGGGRSARRIIALQPADGGRTLLALHEDGLEAWSLADGSRVDGRRVRLERSNREPPVARGLTPAGEVVVAGADERGYAWWLLRGPGRTRLDGPSDSQALAVDVPRGRAFTGDRVVSLADGTRVFDWNADGVRAAVFSADGSRLAVATEDGPAVHLLGREAAFAGPSCTLEGERASLIVGEPRGRWFAVADDDGQVAFRRWTDGALLCAVDGPDQPAALACSADGAWLASGGKREIRVWCAGDRRLVTTIPTPTDVSALAFLDGPRLAIGLVNGRMLVAALPAATPVAWVEPALPNAPPADLETRLAQEAASVASRLAGHYEIGPSFGEYQHERARFLRWIAELEPRCSRFDPGWCRALLAVAANATNPPLVRLRAIAMLKWVVLDPAQVERTLSAVANAPGDDHVRRAAFFTWVKRGKAPVALATAISRDASASLELRAAAVAAMPLDDAGIEALCRVATDDAAPEELRSAAFEVLPLDARSAPLVWSLITRDGPSSHLAQETAESAPVLDSAEAFLLSEVDLGGNRAAVARAALCRLARPGPAALAKLEQLIDDRELRASPWPALVHGLDRAGLVRVVLPRFQSDGARRYCDALSAWATARPELVDLLADDFRAGRIHASAQSAVLQVVIEHSPAAGRALVTVLLAGPPEGARGAAYLRLHRDRDASAAEVMAAWRVLVSDPSDRHRDERRRDARETLRSHPAMTDDVLRAAMDDPGLRADAVSLLAQRGVPGVPAFVDALFGELTTASGDPLYFCLSWLSRNAAADPRWVPALAKVAVGEDPNATLAIQHLERLGPPGRAQLAALVESAPARVKPRIALAAAGIDIAALVALLGDERTAPLASRAIADRFAGATDPAGYTVVLRASELPGAPGQRAAELLLRHAEPAVVAPDLESLLAVVYPDGNSNARGLVELYERHGASPVYLACAQRAVERAGKDARWLLGELRGMLCRREHDTGPETSLIVAAILAAKDGSPNETRPWIGLLGRQGVSARPALETVAERAPHDAVRAMAREVLTLLDARD